MWIPLLRVGGVRVFLDPLVAILLLYLVVSANSETLPGSHFLLIAALALASVALHEAGHAAMARLRGLKVGGIYLHLVSYAYVERGQPADEMRTALAGPATNLLIAAAVYAVPSVHGAFPWTEPSRWLDELLWAVFAINVLLGVLNLVPALPADGGRALRAALMLRMAPAKAYAITARVGTFTGAACVFLAVLLWPSKDAYLAGVIGAYFIMVAWREHQQGHLERRKERAKAKQAQETA